MRPPCDIHASRSRIFSYIFSYVPSYILSFSSIFSRAGRQGVGLERNGPLELEGQQVLLLQQLPEWGRARGHGDGVPGG
eukprot:8784442-Pyramimonas_sp.AAC.1